MIFLVVISWMTLVRDGRNFVSSGKADLDGNQQVDQNELDLINSRIEDNDKLLGDDQWM